MGEIKKKVGAKVFEFRKRIGLTQAELAERADLSTESISRIERGIRSPSFEALERIAKVLGIEIKDFFNFGRKDFEVIAKYNHEVLKLCSYLNGKSNRRVKWLEKIAKIICEQD